MKNLAYWVLGLSRNIKASILITIDSVFVLMALWMAFSLRLGEFYIPKQSIWILFATCPVLATPIFIKLGLYRAIIRYIGVRVLWTIVQAVTLYTLLLTMVVFLYGTSIGLVPRTVPLVNGLILLLITGGTRFIARWWLSDIYSTSSGNVAKESCTKKVIIYGAGNAGVQLASALEYGHDFKAIAFIDDDKRLHKQKVNGLQIYPLSSLADLIKQYRLTELLLALPSATRRRRSEIIRLLEPYPVHVRTMPGLSDIAQGKIKFDELQEVDIADLLGRDAVAPDQMLLHANITDKVVMITGAGGSIGSELCRQIIGLKPAKCILFEANEFALYSIDKELRNAQIRQNIENDFEILSLLGTVTDEVRVNKVCSTFKVQTLYHSAAYKHVPIVEQNPAEAIKNNIMGTLSLARAAIATQVEAFVLISTDKAVRPTNIMGATKRFAELILQGLSLSNDYNTHFTIVRFGNVLDSSGSVIPLFREQIACGGPVTVTDSRIIRYFMTIAEAAQLVIQAGAMGQGGDVFILDMGEPIRIIELAKRMIRLSGLEIKDKEHPEGEIEISLTTLRPGEKLYEELLIGDKVSKTTHCRIMRAEEDIIPWDVLSVKLDKLTESLKKDDFKMMQDVLKDSVYGFVPQGETNDLVFKAKN